MSDQYLKTVNVTTPLEETKVTRHILSHQELRIKFTRVVLGAKEKVPKGMKFYSKRQIQLLPKPIVINRFLEKSIY